jgi:hypothetical protein
MGAAVVELPALGVPTAVSDAAEVRVLYAAGIRRGMARWAAGHSPAPLPPHTPLLARLILFCVRHKVPPPGRLDPSARLALAP